MSPYSVPEKDGWDKILSLNVKSVFYSMFHHDDMSMCGLTHLPLLVTAAWVSRIFLLPHVSPDVALSALLPSSPKMRPPLTLVA